MKRRRIRSAGLLAALALSIAGAASAAEDSARPRLFTHESYVEDATRVTQLPIDDPLGMFAYVLDSLPDRVKVYPTENYYYFSFLHNGTRYAGNIRLDVMDRDRGQVHFAYYEDLAEWKDESPVVHVVLDASQGVTVEKTEPLLYRVAYRDKSVLFALNDLSKVVPGATALAPGERYIGPVFDDSAIRFFLIYNPKLKVFHYVLDETVRVADAFVPAKSTDRIVIGKRTGFAFYRDHKLDRKILIGVFEGNARVNNYFDGPFDQLPDNFIQGDTLRRIILEIEPVLAGKIDRLGGSGDGASRYLIAPYLHYRTEDELDVFHRCATSKEVAAELYYGCFVVDVGMEPDAAAPIRGKPKKAARKRR